MKINYINNMAHKEQFDFIRKVKHKYPDFFNNVRVLDVGSLDINGSNRIHFEKCDYTGIDLAKGRNVDIVCSGHLFKTNELFDTIITTEALEHDPNYVETVKNSITLLRSGGLYIITCASTGRPEHGTARTTPLDSPFTAESNYYKNLTYDDLRSLIDESFYEIYHEYNGISHDLYISCIKK